MKPVPAVCSAALALVLVLLSACVHPGPPPPADGPGKPAAGPGPSAAPGRPETSLTALPPKAREFLSELRIRIRGGDWGWAAERADSSFLRVMEGRGRDPYFYTYLFAAGALAGEDAEYARFELLPVARVRDVAWEEARIEGPAAVVRGRFILTTGAPVPFVLRLLWRLDPPRILGVQP